MDKINKEVSKQNKFRDLMREHIELNKRIAANPDLPMKDRRVAEKKLRAYIVVLGELYI